MPFSPGLAVGFGLILVAAVMKGAFARPMKIMPKWKWENTWMVWTISSLWVLPPRGPGIESPFGRNIPGHLPHGEAFLQN